MAHFQKRHYEAAALAMQDAIRFRATNSEQVAGMYLAAGALADTFVRDNDMFKRDRFMAACQPGANVKART